MLKWLVFYGKVKAFSLEIVHINSIGASNEAKPQDLGLQHSPHCEIYDGGGQSPRPQLQWRIDSLRFIERDDPLAWIYMVE